MALPDRHPEIDDGLGPSTRRGRCGLEDSPGHAERHRRLQLQKAVADPKDSKADPQYPTGHGFFGEPGGGGLSAGRDRIAQPAVLKGPHDVPTDREQRKEGEYQETLMGQRRVERGHNRRVVGLRSLAHSGHQRTVLSAGNVSACLHLLVLAYKLDCFARRLTEPSTQYNATRTLGGCL
jgi:hypothetical protein